MEHDGCFTIKFEDSKKNESFFNRTLSFSIFFCRFCQSISNIERIESFERVTTKKKKVQKNQRKNLIFFSFGIFFSIFYFRAVFFCFCSFTRSVNCGLGLQTRFTTYGNCGRFFFLYFFFFSFLFLLRRRKWTSGTNLEIETRVGTKNQRFFILFYFMMTE